MNLRHLLAIFLATWLWIPPAVAAPGELPATAPRLLVILVVDQLRADYITTYGHQWKHGLRRLVDEGAWFSEAAYPYLNTVTCPGHATIGTGSFPAKHGMILNSWWDRELGHAVSCTGDESMPQVGLVRQVGGGESPRWLLVPTMAQRLRQYYGQENVRVVSLSRKARSAIMLAGPDADVVVWYAGDGNWATSAMYSAPGSLREFLRAHPVEKDFRAVWTRSLPESQYLYKDRAPGEHPSPSHWNDRFPHRLRGNSKKPDSSYFRAWSVSPFVDDYLSQMAIAAADHLQLGRGTGPDVLAIGFSALDSVGHAFGPRSHEVQDTLVRLDATIGRLLDHLDRTVGRGNYVVALSADHGVATVPEQLLAEGTNAGRVATTSVSQVAQLAAEKHLGPGKHVQAVTYTDLYFTAGTYEKLLARPEALAGVIDAILRVPGVAGVFRGDQLPQQRKSGDPLERAAALSYFPGRSGDLIVVPRENWFFVTGSDHQTPATHGTAHWYDARVPVIFWGHGIQPGKYPVTASPADIAPTLAALCSLNMLEADGRVLGEALAPGEKIRVLPLTSLIH